MRRAAALWRFLGSVCIVSGVLLLADVAVTLAWQEPLSSLLAKREQSRLADALEGTTRTLLARPPGESGGQGGSRMAELATRMRASTRVGDAIGRVRLPTLDRSYVMVHGTGTTTLRKGPGHYEDTPWPGQRGTVAVAGHRTTYLAPFRTIDDLRRGDPIVLAMPYGRFEYRVERTQIVPPDAVWVKRRVRHDRLILTACHPLYSAKQRIVVFARLVRTTPVLR